MSLKGPGLERLEESDGAGLNPGTQVSAPSCNDSHAHEKQITEFQMSLEESSQNWPRNG